MTDAQKWLILAGTVAVGWLLYLLAPILTPFLVAALLAYLGDPLVDRIEARGTARTVAVGIVFMILVAGLLALVLLLIPLLDHQVRSLIRQLPDYIAWVQNALLPFLATNLGLEPDGSTLEALKQSVQENWQEAGGIAAGLVSSISRSGLALVGWMANLLLIPVVTFYLLRDWDHLVAGVRDLFPRPYVETVSKLARESDEVLAGFLRGQFLVMLGLGGVYAVGLWLAGLNLAFLVGLVAGLVSFVPYLGFILGMLMAGIAMIVQTGSPLDLLLVLAVFTAGQVLESVLFQPLLVGDRIGLHPVAVIFAVLAGGQLFGFVGVLLGLPAAAVIAVFVRHAHERYLESQLYHQGAEEE
ncbi:AI-2E family transporter [Thiohalorhabdus sp. Cl-TMA]|uniref:AI-2E family transporter n=1 Tax=Thiohalorhabdus methylotrophus TaxID=3242694 RepID=A0ABV4TWX9_9GAMM